MEHTNGPWFITRDGFSTVYVEARIPGHMIQEVAACGPTAEGPDQQESNARLISAAPDLLSALKQCLEQLEIVLPASGLVHDERQALINAKAAISKATNA